MTSRIQELINQKEQLEKTILEERKRLKAEGIEKVKMIIEEYDLDISEIFPNFSSKSKVSKLISNKVPPKYRNPDSGETWTGRGKAPLWIANKDRNSFII